MSKKLFAILLVLTVAVGALLLLRPDPSRNDGAFTPSEMLPGLADAVNTLDWVQIVEAGDQVVATLRRQDDRWVVEEASGYTADWERLRSALAALAQARKVEPKTSNPDYYDRLGVEALSSEDAQGLLLRFAPESGIPGVIVGNVAQGRGGQYARLDGAAESYLLDREVDLASDTSEWLERSIVSIADEEVVEVEIRHADGERIRISRASTDDSDFSLEDIPEGREVQSNWAVNSLAGALNNLDLDDVMPRPDALPEGAVRYRSVTAGGLVIETDWFEQAENGSWVVLNASAYSADDSEETVSERIRDINQRVAGWAYRVPDYKFDNATKRLEDLLNDIETTATPGGEGP